MVAGGTGGGVNEGGHLECVSLYYCVGMGTAMQAFVTMMGGEGGH